ncbi:MAG: hypothetical protein AVDCRST_MAG35-1599, partial [uncultured Quadrisphaera sp.]
GRLGARGAGRRPAGAAPRRGRPVGGAGPARRRGRRPEVPRQHGGARYCEAL